MTDGRPDAGRERRAVVAELVRAVLAYDPGVLIVTGLGSPTWDVFAAGDRDLTFPLWGAMGAAVPVGLGLALARPDRSVLVVTGDGEQLMGVGALGTVAAQRPPNLTIVVLDNGRFGETGMQPSHTSLGTDLVAVARGFGITEAVTAEDGAGVADLARRITARGGPTFARIPISSEEPPRALPPRDGVHLKNRFRAALGLGTF